jgi:hypothetical protein
MSIRDTLDCIHSKARWLSYYAAEMDQHVRRLAAIRSFETNAEAAMAQAEVELTEVLRRIKNARAAYAAKQINDRAA